MRQLIEAGLRSPWHRLALPDPLERRYHQELVPPSGWYLQSWLIVLIAFNAVSTWVDIDTFGLDAIAIPFGLTAGVYVPLALVSIFACRGRPSQSRQAVIAAVNGFVDMAIILNSARMAPPAKIDTYLILAALVPFAVGAIVTIPFRHGLFFYGACFTLYAAAAFTPPLSERFEDGLPLLCMGLILVPLKIGFTREKDSKRGFLLDLLGRVQADELREANERLTVLSGTDPLTGLCNRRAFADSFEAAWSQAQSAERWFGVALIDVDHFKLFNDAHGHGEGDRCLVEVSTALNRIVIEAGGTMGRFGGEEFAAYWPEASPDIVGEIAHRLLVEIRGLAIPHRGLSLGRTVSVSIGVTTVHGTAVPQDITTARLLAAADRALYTAKRSGRDKVVREAMSAAVPREHQADRVEPRRDIVAAL